MKDNRLISVVIPSYNEEENIPVIGRKLQETFAALPYKYEFIFVDDGSSDSTLTKIKELALSNEHVFFVEFSRNFGHQCALKAGIDICRGDCVISLDADMQHPVELIPALIAKWEEGYDVVYTRRMDDPSLSYMKCLTSRLFYRFLNRLSKVKLEQGVADFRLIDRKVADVFISLKENSLFIRGLIAWLGFKQIGIDYFPHKRYAGESKYNFSKMFRFALEGITSFSTKPLIIAVYLGFFSSLIALLCFPYVIYSIYTNHAVAGWSSVITAIVFFGGMQLSVLGIIGLYIGKLFMQAKERPLYIINNTNITK